MTIFWWNFVLKKVKYRQGLELDFDIIFIRLSRKLFEYSAIYGWIWPITGHKPMALNIKILKILCL